MWENADQNSSKYGTLLAVFITKCCTSTAARFCFIICQFFFVCFTHWSCRIRNFLSFVQIFLTCITWFVHDLVKCFHAYASKWSCLKSINRCLECSTFHKKTRLFISLNKDNLRFSFITVFTFTLLSPFYDI